MHQPASAAPQPASPTFAGLLAGLASRPSAAANRTPVWNDSDLADDVATLSYERALRAHGRYRASDLADPPFARPVEALPAPILEPAPIEAETAVASFGADATCAPGTHAVAAEETAIAADRNLKSASITIRLSKAECDQLRKRAAEAGLTVSAYLRSCTFEAESLRALVKDTLANLRSEPTPQHGAEAGTGVKLGWRNWLGQHLPHGRSRQRTARA